jgi:hypothetical protein
LDEGFAQEGRAELDRHGHGGGVGLEEKVVREVIAEVARERIRVVVG